MQLSSEIEVVVECSITSCITREATKKNLFKSIRFHRRKNFFLSLECVCISFRLFWWVWRCSSLCHCVLSSQVLAHTQFIFHILFFSFCRCFWLRLLLTQSSWRSLFKWFHIFVVIFHYWVFNIAPWFFVRVLAASLSRSSRPSAFGWMPVSFTFHLLFLCCETRAAAKRAGKKRKKINSLISWHISTIVWLRWLSLSLSEVFSPRVSHSIFPKLFLLSLSIGCPSTSPKACSTDFFCLSQFFHITLASSSRFSIFPLFFCIDNSSIPATWIPHWIPTVCMMECGMRRDGEDESESSWKKYNFPWVARQKIMKLCFIKLQQQIDFLLILLYMCGEREEKEVGCISQKNLQFPSRSRSSLAINWESTMLERKKIQLNSSRENLLISLICGFLSSLSAQTLSCLANFSVVNRACWRALLSLTKTFTFCSWWKVKLSSFC